MIDINRNNYEEYFLDFLEGNLSPSKEALLMSFLDNNPDLKEELDLLNELPEIKIEETFLEKSTLKKSASSIENNSDNFNELCIARVEGDLSEEANKEFGSFLLENDKRKKEFELFKLTKLKADESVVFENKQRLKKNTFSIFLTKNRYSIMSAAASIIIALAVFTLIPKNTEVIPLNIAEVEKTEDEKAVIEEVRVEQFSNEHFAEVIEPDRLAGVQEIVEKEQVSNKAEIIEKENFVDTFNIIEQKNYYQYEKLMARAIKVDNQPINRSIVYPEYVISQIAVPEFKNRHLSVKSIIAGVINKEVFNRDRKAKIEMFDVAQASLNGINRITGSNMSLTRIYDENGAPDKTEFNSRLIAFSTPAKKD